MNNTGLVWLGVALVVCVALLSMRGGMAFCEAHYEVGEYAK